MLQLISTVLLQVYNKIRVIKVSSVIDLVVCLQLDGYIRASKPTTKSITLMSNLSLVFKSYLHYATTFSMQSCAESAYHPYADEYH